VIAESLQANPSERLLIGVFTGANDMATSLRQQLTADQHEIIVAQSQSDFFMAISKNRHQLDCLILHEAPILPSLVQWLHENATLLPTVVIQPATADQSPDTTKIIYHVAEVRIVASQVTTIMTAIERAIAEFLRLSPTRNANVASDRSIISSLDMTATEPRVVPTDPSTQHFVLVKQHQLAEKLKERLGYLGVYYKRNPKFFFRNMTVEEQDEFLAQMHEAYQEIILTYFDDNPKNNQKIDYFIDTAFLADLSVAKVVEIHMDLINEFSKQLKLEGRSEEILLDYRLTLIDTLAHLCEIYRRSVPRDIPDAD
jgi:circadian clock protein KaiA